MPLYIYETVYTIAQQADKKNVKTVNKKMKKKERFYRWKKCFKNIFTKERNEKFAFSFLLYSAEFVTIWNIFFLDLQYFFEKKSLLSLTAQSAN